MKKRSVFTLLTAVLLAGMFMLSGCGDKNKAFIGTFNSTFVEGTNASSYTFTLTVSSDNTFTLTKFDIGAQAWISNGTWAGNTSKDTYGIICLIKKSGRDYTYSSAQFTESYSYTEYFTLTLLDDGSVIASPGIVSAFGLSAGCIVIFEKI